MLLTSLACLPIFWTRGRISRLEGGCCSASMRFTSPTTSCREPSWLIGRMNTGCCCSVGDAGRDDSDHHADGHLLAHNSPQRRSLPQVGQTTIQLYFHLPITCLIEATVTYIVTNSSDTEGCSAMVRSKSALVAPMPTAMAAI